MQKSQQDQDSNAGHHAECIISVHVPVDRQLISYTNFALEILENTTFVQSIYFEDGLLACFPIMQGKKSTHPLRLAEAPPRLKIEYSFP